MDAVAPDASARDDDFIAGQGFLFVRGFAVNGARDEADGADEY